ncbi:hypothetical protein PN419_00560 [Halorubrum ezzemoulense]|uniref:hypothetical protein n=1 Tax=Halorubrum ezzemoulense TaxID=337243 RepID=UPI0023310CFE|nr:hypothetical protein [Halorubrum ezzemoulense]MDB9247499.1 hypothetical protein [Halorubrum ezzemoulense]MDB9258592.1 hypothetical protein [Halorubrum ezzemoulense]MDB9264549.1 hypothetical protein [Halorubrum ezzemoulense]MDB9268953.1 hypothetical protein [Halorubrum ezzemoulense]MDB9271517.1 hypothetical protein [Halorubrum ezzemoulense]
MDPPFALDERAVSALPHTDTVAACELHTDGCSCTERRRPRTIVARYPSHDAELWACVRCGGLYWRPSVADDHEAAPQTMKDEYNVSVTV